MKRIFIITGTPGVGKTTISKELAERLMATHIDLNRIIRKEGLFVDVDEVRMTLIPDTEVLLKRILETLESIEDVIIDGHFGVDVLPTEKIHTVFVLRRDPYELREILKNRGYKGRKLWENIAAEILDICLIDAIEIYGTEKVNEIDLTGKEINDITEKMKMIIQGRAKGSVGHINWLDKLNKNDALKDFFRFF